MLFQHLLQKSLEKNLKLIPVDFTQPWWSLIINQKRLVFWISIIVIGANVFWSLSPFLIVYVFETGTVQACAMLFALWLFVDTSFTYISKLNAEFQLQCIHSIHQSAHQYLLTVDPRYHVHRSSGTILGKIERAARGYEDLLDQITWEFLPLTVGLVSIIIVLAKYSIWLSLGMALFFVVMVVAGYYFARNTCQAYEQGFIKTDDEFRATAVENLAQIQLIRAVFASDYMSKKLSEKIEINMRTEGGLWLIYNTTKFVLNVLYLIAIFCLIAVLVWQVNHGITTLASAFGLTVAFVQSTKDLVKILKPFRKYMRGWMAVKDLWNFMPAFGKQGYPVLGPASALDVKNHVITLQARNISFDYETAHLFNHHTFVLTCEQSQPNKLYGIIGPSGSGKTTLLSILGGQLKPIEGTVIVNGVDIYSVNDAARRQLIALQSQTATSVRGTVKYNLLFGLPENHGYDDRYLLEILKRVGLLNVLSAHQGLQTMLGEGGLNLSGGQRQRLNFAGLYLRALHYKPLLILIDEPTSSLDELSEAAITSMIMELAHSSLTLVIAHRLKTVEDAMGLIDLSLLGKEKEIRPCPMEKLAQRSDYYRQLVEGIAQLDS